VELTREIQALEGPRSLVKEIFVKFYYSQGLIVDHHFKTLPMIALLKVFTLCIFGVPRVRDILTPYILFNKHSLFFNFFLFILL
jgi:hypothetical protein